MMKRSATSTKAGNDIVSRALPVQPSSVDQEGRSVEATLNTESPVEMFDYERWEWIPEVLLTKGASYPEQIPLLDSHNRERAGDQLGSIRDIRKTQDGIVVRLFFSSTAEREWSMVKEGHLTDVSAGYSYRSKDKIFIPAGEKGIVDGREYHGPVNVVRKWRLREGSLTPIGADELAKLRGVPPQSRGVRKMNPKLREILVARGMPADLSDDEAGAWQNANLDKVFASSEAKVEGQKAAPAAPAIDADEISTRAADKAVAAAMKMIKEEQAQRAAFLSEVDQIVDLSGLAGERDHCRTLPDLAAVRKHLIEKKAAGADVIANTPISFGPAARDIQVEGMRTALTLRALGQTGASGEAIERAVPVSERSKHAADFSNRSMLDMAELCLQLDGYNTRRLSREQIAIAALGFPYKVGLRGAYDPAYHVTGSFLNLTQDAQNKSMMIGYKETRTTWQTVFRQGPSVADFKTIHRYRIGAIPNLPDWADNSDMEQASLADAQENYKVECKALKISFSYRLLVNDDMSMISRIPQMFGAAAARTVNALAWGVITTNPTMSDSVALFATATGARKRTNLTTGSGTAPSVASRQVMASRMALMRGENTPEGNESADILGLYPAYIVGPTALETTIQQLVNSAFDPAGTNSITYNPARTLTPVIEPLLDAASATAWYLFAGQDQIDTVEVTFLQGHETPQTNHWSDPEKMSQNTSVYQACAARALNHRGMQANDGA